MREAMTTQILYGFEQKNRGVFLRVVLVQVQKFQTKNLQLCGKRLKLKVRKCCGKLAGSLCTPHPPD